jgi:hypothetical protein
MTKLKIDKTLAAYLGPASKFADAELERQLIAEGGPREPVYVWNGTIIDGHRRYLVCEKHKLPYKIVEVDLPDRDAVREWMDRHQFCRRNVSQNEEYRHIARLVAGKAAETGSKSEAVKAVAEEIGKTERQVWRDVVADEQYTEDVEALDPVVKQAIEDSGERLSKNALHSLATLEPEHQKRVAAEVELGEFSSFREAILGEKQGKKRATDIMSVSPAPKPKDDYFKEIMRQLGTLKKVIGDTHKYFPCGKYRELVNMANTIDKTVKEWQG